MSIDYEKEVAEAVNAANDALYYLSNAEEVLKKARNWGIADIMGGGMIITAVKRQRMREAENELRKARDAMSKLNRELLDLDGWASLDIRLDDFLEIADYIFDNFWTDMMSQSRINNARNQVANAIEQVEGILDALSELQAELG
jgi:predicted translin family RNA/ssDNA-binding protein